jgi:hypothetical protein
MTFSLLKFILNPLAVVRAFQLGFGGGGGGAPAPQTSTVNQSNLPEYARPYFEDIMARGQTASQVEYQPYTGQRVADFNPMQQQAFQGVAGLGPSPLNAPAAGFTGAAGIGGLGAGQQYQQMATSPGAMQAYMSPYMQNVVDFQKSQAIQDYGRQLPGQQAAATRAGAFGGSRQAIVESEAQRNLQNQLAGIQATGTQSAFDQARQAQQFGSQLGLQGLGLAGQMGQQFGQLGQTAFGQQAAAAQAQQQAGAIQQAQTQQGLDQNYEEFMRQQFYPQSQLQFYSSLLRGVPVSPQQTQYSYQAAPSMASQIGGLGLGALGLSKAFGAKDGGEVPGYAEGGVTGGGGLASNVSKMVKLLMASQNPERDIIKMGGTRLEQAMALEKVRQMRGAAQNQQALQGGQPQGTVLDEMGLGGLDVDMDYADGGIVAFQDGGMPRGQRPFDITDPFGLMSGLRSMREEFQTPKTEAEARRARQLQAMAEAEARARMAETPGVAPSAGLPAALPQPASTQIQGRPATRPEDFARPPAPTAALTPDAQQTPPARAAATAAPAVKSEAPAARPSLLDTGITPQEEFLRKDAEMEKRFPSEMKERLAELKTQAQEAIKERDKDRWLALAAGGFEMMRSAEKGGRGAGAFLRDLGAGLGLTTKQIGEVNKDFRKAQDLRNKAEREERKIDRLEQTQKFSAADKARDRREDAIAAAAKADANLQAKFEEIGVTLLGVQSRERVGMAQVGASRELAATTRADTLFARNVAAYNTAVQNEKNSLIKSNPVGAATDPQFESKMEQQAIRNIIARNPQFAELAGVSAGTAQPGAAAPMQGWGKASVVGR